MMCRPLLIIWAFWVSIFSHIIFKLLSGGVDYTYITAAAVIHMV